MPRSWNARLSDLDHSRQAQRIRRVDVKSLPPILQPFANEFSLALEKDPDNRTASFQRLYFDVLLAAMAKRPTLLMIDEAHYCDQLSLTVIAAVAHRMSMHRRNTRKTLSRSASATASSCIILATCGPLHFMAPEWIPSLTDGFFTEVPWGVCISITPLDASGIEGLALRVLGSQGLRSDLLALLQGAASTACVAVPVLNGRQHPL